MGNESLNKNDNDSSIGKNLNDAYKNSAPSQQNKLIGAGAAVCAFGLLCKFLKGLCGGEK